MQKLTPQSPETQEEWRAIPGYEGIYEVSSFGRIKSLKRYHHKKDRILSLIRHPCGYRCVNLSLDGNATKTLIHQLVTKAFLGQCPDGLEINHKNGKKADNRLVNLEYVTRSQNHFHSRRVLGRTVGETHGMAKLTNQQVFEIRALAGTMSHEKIGKRFGVSGSAAGNIIRRKRWKHI